MNGKIYTDAAMFLDRMEGEWGACEAISNQRSRVPIRAINKFTHYLAPETTYGMCYWYGGFTKKNKLARTLGLLLMAELSKELEND